MMIRKIYILLCVTLLAAGSVRSQELVVEPRIVGLEQNAEYMSLLREDAQLQALENTTVSAVENVRRLLRENPANRQQYSQEILQFENKIFEIRNAKGRLIDRINAIEQEWVMTNLNSSGPQSMTTPEAPAAISDSLKVRNLIDNLYFRRELPAADYAALRKAQQFEMQAVDYINRYVANHVTSSDLAVAYAAAATEGEALDIQGRYTTILGLNRVLSDSLSEAWNYIFDNKSYAYGYLLDKLRKDEILAREQEAQATAAQQFATLRDQTASDAVVDYFLRKRVLVDYESSLADVLGLDAARDSLRGVAKQLAAVDYRLPKVELAERNFLDYDSIAFSSVAKYSYKHPIPECRVYARGTIYRILLGTFNTKRAAETFRGAFPLSYLINDENKWCYYAGGFATKVEAEQAQKQLKTRGFARPEIVQWTDGVARNITREPEAQSESFRVEITGAEALSDVVKNAITETALGAELSRVGPQLFVVGAFEDKVVADRVAAAMQHADPALEIKVARIAE